jgi:NADP-dependent 3-hydroxy acid dehydrogenase YdfG
VTGAAAGIMAGVAMILVGIGGVLMVAGRRRRKVNFEG